MIKLLAAALLLAPASAFAQQQHDLAADFAALQSRIFQAQSEIMAHEAEAQRLTRPLPKDTPKCAIKYSDPDSVPAKLRDAVNDVARHIIAVNRLSIPDFCGFVVVGDEQFNAGSVVEPIPLQDDDQAEADAAAFARKYVQVNVGVLEQVQDDSELACVIGHELAHLVLGHPRDMQRRHEAGQAIADDWAESPFQRPDYDALTRWFLGNSQADELEADRMGAIYAARAGYDPRGALRLFARVQSPRLPAGVIADHPSNADRIAVFTKEEGEILAARAKAKPVLRLARIRELLQ